MTIESTRSCLTVSDVFAQNGRMKQRYHTIIKPRPDGWFVGWVEEVPGTITVGHSLDECRDKLRDSLQVMLETHRDEARQSLDPSCILESIEIEVCDMPPETQVPWS